MRRQTLAVLALAPALALGAQGCGTGAGDTQAAGTAKADADEAKMREFAECMRKNGVDMPDPEGGRIQLRATRGPGGSGPGDDKIEAAQQKCRHLMPNGGRPPSARPEQAAKMREFAKCMREHGITEFPDPEPGGGIKIRAGRGSGLNPDGQEFKDAEKACAKFRPSGGPATSSGGN